IPNAEVAYTVNGGLGTVLTDTDGRYTIYAKKNDNVVIASISDAGVHADLPVKLIIDKRVTEVDFKT
ncbi:MAG: hypothetical protein LBH69_03815, partial [Methanomassiliicoccaceae archaeon]|nr:hypothetical protein [Methanomassiliicoccaceae archaeon]